MKLRNQSGHRGFGFVNTSAPQGRFPEETFARKWSFLIITSILAIVVMVCWLKYNVAPRDKALMQQYGQPPQQHFVLGPHQQNP